MKLNIHPFLIPLILFVLKQIKIGSLGDVSGIINKIYANSPLHPTVHLTKKEQTVISYTPPLLLRQTFPRQCLAPRFWIGSGISLGCLGC